MASGITKTITHGVLSIHRALYRLTGGKIGSSMGKMDVLLLTTIGRKTGKERTWPLAYFRDGDNLLVVGSNSGGPTDPAWAHNLRSNPVTTVQLGAQTIKVRAEQASPAESERLWPVIIAKSPNFADYRKKTTREIPIMILHPIS